MTDIEILRAYLNGEYVSKKIRLFLQNDNSSTIVRWCAFDYLMRLGWYAGFSAEQEQARFVESDRALIDLIRA